jgi:cytochrome c-type biogenesis protein CcmH
MLVFWILATLMTAVALAFVLIPLLRARAVTGPTSVEANLEVLRAQRREIEADIEFGTLPADARDEALAELVERASDDLAPGAASAPAARKPWATAALVAVALPAAAFAMYLVGGTPRAVDPAVAVARPDAPMDEKQVVAMVETLSKKVRERPDDVQGWTLLGQSMASLGRFEEAAAAYEHLGKLVPNDPDILAEHADALGMAQGRTLEGRPFELVKRALEINARHPKALALAASAAMDAQDFPTALTYWQRLAAELPPDSEDGKQVQAMIEDVGRKAQAAGKPRVAAAQPAAAPLERKAFAPLPKTVTGSVSIAPEMAARLSGTETVYIFARAVNGPRVPLAVLRVPARQLPMRFTLDDSLAMAPNMLLSGAESVRVEARISRTGNAMPQSGDLVGGGAVVKPGARDVRIVVDKALP